MATGEQDLSGRSRNPDVAIVNALINQIRRVVLCIALAIWAVVGFLFWIPMLVFAIVRFSALVAYATIADVNPSALAIKLEHAIRFYVEGFRNVVRALYRKPDATASGTTIPIDWSRVTTHVFGTCAFWAAVLSAVFWSIGNSTVTSACGVVLLACLAGCFLSLMFSASAQKPKPT